MELKVWFVQNVKKRWKGKHLSRQVLKTFALLWLLKSYDSDEIITMFCNCHFLVWLVFYRLIRWWESFEIQCGWWDEIRSHFDQRKPIEGFVSWWIYREALCCIAEWIQVLVMLYIFCSTLSIAIYESIFKNRTMKRTRNRLSVLIFFSSSYF